MSYMSIPGTLFVPKEKKIIADRDEIFHTVCAVFAQQPAAVLESGKCRKRDYVIVKQVTMTLFRLKTNLSLSAIGNYFQKDHATALHSLKTVRNLRETDKEFRKQTDILFAGVQWPYVKN